MLLQILFILPSSWCWPSGFTFGSTSFPDLQHKQYCTPTHVMNSTNVQNPRHKLGVFSSVIASAKSDHMFQKLSNSLCWLCLSLWSLITLPQTVRLFYLFNCILRLVHRAFLFFDVKVWPQSQTDLFTCTTVLHCGHTLLRCIDLIYSIALWAYLSAPLVKDIHKCLSSTEKPQYHVLQHLPLHTCYGEVYGNIACK